MNREQYIAYRRANDFLGICFQYYKEKLKEKGIKTGMGEDFFRSTFGIWPFNGQAFSETVTYYDAKFSVTTVEKDGKIIKIE